MPQYSYYEKALMELYPHLQIDISVERLEEGDLVFTLCDMNKKIWRPQDLENLKLLLKTEQIDIKVGIRCHYSRSTEVYFEVKDAGVYFPEVELPEASLPQSVKETLHDQT